MVRLKRDHSAFDTTSMCNTELESMLADRKERTKCKLC